jgi:predicted HTH transcriptional regulator
MAPNSKSLQEKKSKRGEEDILCRETHGRAVTEYISANGSIDNAACQQLTGLGRYSALRLLRNLANDGLIITQGSGRSTKYTSPGKS